MGKSIHEDSAEKTRCPYEAAGWINSFVFAQSSTKIDLATTACCSQATKAEQCE